MFGDTATTTRANVSNKYATPSPRAAQIRVLVSRSYAASEREGQACSLPRALNQLFLPGPQNKC